MSSEAKIDIVSANEKLSNEKINSSIFKRHIVKIKLIAATVCILLLAIFLIKFSDVLVDKSKEVITKSPISGVQIVKRVMWQAEPPMENPQRLKVIPAPYVIISHTATEFCFTQAQCTLNVRNIQVLHINSYGWDDIGYNFLVGGDGNVYEGCGWDVEGAHTYGYNSKSIGISLIGNFIHAAPSKSQLDAAQKLIEYGVKTGKISKDYKLLGHKQCVDTLSPGQKAYEIIQTWDHWAPKP